MKKTTDEVEWGYRVGGKVGEEGKIQKSIQEEMKKKEAGEVEFC